MDKKNDLPMIGLVEASEQSLKLCLPIPVTKNRMFMVNNGRMIHSPDVRKFYQDTQLMFFNNKAINDFAAAYENNNNIVRITHLFYMNHHKKDLSGMFVSLYDALEKITGISDNKYYPDFTDARYTSEEERVLVTLRFSKTSFYKSKIGGESC